jgi:hypothetical protein
MIQKVSNRVRLLVTKVIVEAVTDSTAIQLLKLNALNSETLEGIERLQNYGLTSNPPADSEAIALEVGGARDNLIVVAVDNSASRQQNLNSGETAFYSEHGQKIHHHDDGTTSFNDGADFMVRFTKLEEGFNQLRTDLNSLVTSYNAHIHPIAGAVQAAPPVPVTSAVTVSQSTFSTASIAQAKIDEIKVP